MTNNETFLGNIEAEEAILGGILLDPEAIGRVADKLPTAAFYTQAHQTIYSAALTLHQQDKQTDLISVTTYLANHKLLENAGGQPKLAQLLNRTVSATNIDRYAVLVLDKYQRREIVHTGHEIVELGYDTTTELEAVIDAVEDKVHGLTTNNNGKSPTLSVNERLADIWNQLEQGALPNYPTGLTDLDFMIGGLTKKDLVIVAARPSMGKSWFACYLANYIASNEKKPVVFFSAEMDGNQLTKRFLAMHTGIDSQRLMNNDIKRSEMDTLVKGLGTLAELPIEINDTPAEQLTPAKMRSLVEENPV